MELKEYKIGDNVEVFVTITRKSELVEEWCPGCVVQRTDFPWELTWKETFVQVEIKLGQHTIPLRVYEKNRIRIATNQ